MKPFKMKAFRMLYYLVKRFPLYVICYFVNEILTALPRYVGNVLLLKYMMRALLDREPISEMLAVLAGIALFLIGIDIYGAWFDNHYKPCAEERIQKEFYYNIKNAAGECELGVYDNPAFYDDMTYINENIVKDSLALLSYVSRMTAGLINILLIINLFYEIGPEMLVISVSAVILSIVFDVPMMRLQNERKYVVSSIERKRAYFRGCFFMRESFLERRMTSIDSLLHSGYDESVNEQIACERQFGGKLFLLKSLQELLSSYLLMNFVLTAYLLYKVLVTGTLRGSDFVATYNAVNVIVNDMMQIVKLWGQMAESTYTIGKYQKLISSVPREERFGADKRISADKQKEHSLGTGKCEARNFQEVHSIEFRNVSFAYPGTEKKVLKNISFCIRSGEKIAVVGRNGSGKTTLVHLLMGLYYPSEGEILVDGKALRREEYPQYRRRFAAFFQGMKPMEAVAAENVALDVNVDMDKVNYALGKTDGCDVFPEPEKQMIGVRFQPDGLILSGGETQKLMLAHCFYSGRSMLVMDEPSSALDPMAESDFNTRIAELSEDRLVIFVTHRLSAVHMADCIYVIDDGRLAGQGSHDKLLREGGVYHDMWNAKAMK